MTESLRRLMDDEEKVRSGLLWITNLLSAHGIPFILTGGLAARAYGAQRQIHDIDLDVPERCFERVATLAGPRLFEGPVRHRDDNWDLLTLGIDYDGQEIDISGADTIRIRDERTGQWNDMPTDVSEFRQREILGVLVPVQPPERLIAYKSMLQGAHQQEDIRAVEEFLQREL